LAGSLVVGPDDQMMHLPFRLKIEAEYEVLLSPAECQPQLFVW
jgi:hypothetical protein